MQANVNPKKKSLKLGSGILELMIIVKTPIKVLFNSLFEIQWWSPARLVDMGSWLSCG
jgi:hypothetical protein